MKKILIGVALVVLVIFMVTTLKDCAYSIEDEWAVIELKDKLPTPTQGKLQDGSNLSDCFFGGIEEVSKDYYIEYRDACIAMGYTVESESDGTRYEAFNEEGYELSLSYVGEDISIILNAPEELSEIEWPTKGLAKKLPVPDSTLGNISADRSDYFSVILGEMSIDQYQEYVEACEDKGFTIDYSKDETYYNAENKDGYKVYVAYEGCNRVSIRIEEVAEETTTTEKETTTTTQEESDDKDDIDSDFKEAMDAYEEFMNDYVAFMKKYQANPTDLELLADYSEFLSDYADYCDEFAEWEDEDLNDAELKYYLEVQSRVNKKLLEVAG